MITLNLAVKIHLNLPRGPGANLVFQIFISRPQYRLDRAVRAMHGTAVGKSSPRQSVIILCLQGYVQWRWTWTSRLNDRLAHRWGWGGRAGAGALHQHAEV